MVVSFLLRLVPQVPGALSTDGIVGEMETVATGRRIVVHDGHELVDALRRELDRAADARDTTEERR